nr:hypothetical protein [Paenibacillus hamazuiensis]
MLCVSYAAIWLLPKRLPRSVAIVSLVWGFASSTLFDFTIGGGMMDFYRVNDSNRYELTDLLTYFMFAPFGYFFVYFYEWLHIRKKTFLLYVAGWSAVGMGFEWLAERVHMTQYQLGFRPEYNLAVFLVVQTTTGLVYEYLKHSKLMMVHVRKPLK